jgi:hypothetical protein
VDILLRFLTQTLRENQTQLQLSEMRKRQMYMLQHDSQDAMRRGLLLA